MQLKVSMVSPHLNQSNCFQSSKKSNFQPCLLGNPPFPYGRDQCDKKPQVDVGQKELVAMGGQPPMAAEKTRLLPNMVVLINLPKEIVLPLPGTGDNNSCRGHDLCSRNFEWGTRWLCGISCHPSVQCMHRWKPDVLAHWNLRKTRPAFLGPKVSGIPWWC